MENKIIVANLKNYMSYNDTINYLDQVETIKNKVILENRKKDPYGIKLFKTGFEELNYEDKDGKPVLKKSAAGTKKGSSGQGKGRARTLKKKG